MNALVKIIDKEVERIEYRGETVITLRQIDELHERPEGTAKRTLYSHMSKLIVGVDFFAVPYEEWKTLKVRQTSFQKGGRKGKLYLLTETGYLMVTKPFTDDRSWQIQRLLVNTYFKAKAAVHTISGDAEERVTIPKDLYISLLEARLSAQGNAAATSSGLPLKSLSAEALIWDMPPLYHRLYTYIRRRTARGASLVTSLRQLAEGIAYRHRGIEKVPNKKSVWEILEWMRRSGIIEVKHDGYGTTITLLQRR
ncbi:MAG: ORF6N domain-containing protein [Nitrospirae bacterium]|nr:ORF6N domain-containing protein [Nitrospirota bacterium]MCL5238656.1 ORF6N domain-containing protein [Nitrospirota bacterium]